MAFMQTDTIERTESDERVDDGSDSDRPKHFHYVKKDKIAESAVMGTHVVALCGEPVLTVRELLPVVERAQRAGRPLVVAAPEFSTEVIDTLAANTVRGKEQCIPVVVTADQSAQITEHTLATALPHSDLQAGWVPEAALGTVETWVSDRNRSWMVQPAE